MNSRLRKFLRGTLASVLIFCQVVDPSTAFAYVRPITAPISHTNRFNEEALATSANWAARSLLESIGPARTLASTLVLASILILAPQSVGQKSSKPPPSATTRFSLRHLLARDKAKSDNQLRKQINAAAERVESHIKNDHWLGPEGQRLLPILQEYFTNPQKRDYLLVDRDWLNLTNSLIYEENKVIHTDQILHASPEELETFIVGLVTTLLPEQHDRWEAIAILYRYESDMKRWPDNCSAQNTKKILAMWVKNVLDAKKTEFDYVKGLAQSAHTNVYDYLEKRPKEKSGTDIFSFTLNNGDGINENLTRIILLNNLSGEIQLGDRVQAIAKSEKIDLTARLALVDWELSWLTNRDYAEALGTPSKLDPPSRPAPRPPSHPDPSALLLTGLGIATLAHGAAPKVEDDLESRIFNFLKKDENRTRGFTAGILREMLGLERHLKAEVGAILWRMVQKGNIHAINGKKSILHSIIAEPANAEAFINRSYIRSRVSEDDVHRVMKEHGRPMSQALIRFLLNDWRDFYPDVYATLKSLVNNGLVKISGEGHYRRYELVNPPLTAAGVSLNHSRVPEPLRRAS